MIRWLALIIVLSGFGDTVCRAQGGAPAPERVPSLDQLSVAQRRVFLRGCVTDWSPATDDRKGVPAPPVQKPCPPDARRVDLIKPADFKVGRMAVADAIRDRRSRREYSDAALTLEELSYLLWATQGLSGQDRDAKDGGDARFRTVPSAGARHPLETYLVVNRVAGLKPGLYRYLPLGHQLLVVREETEIPARLTAACYGQAFTGKSAVTFVWSAIPYRTEWHYGCIAEKMVAIDAGHVCQNLYLAAESIGAGCCAVLGYHQTKMDALVGVDGQDEFVVYLAAVGKPHASTTP